MTDKWLMFCSGFNSAAFLEAVAMHDWLWVFVFAVALAMAALHLLAPDTKEAA